MALYDDGIGSESLELMDEPRLVTRLHLLGEGPQPCGTDGAEHYRALDGQGEPPVVPCLLVEADGGRGGYRVEALGMMGDGDADGLGPVGGRLYMDADRLPCHGAVERPAHVIVLDRLTGEGVGERELGNDLLPLKPWCKGELVLARDGLAERAPGAPVPVHDSQLALKVHVLQGDITGHCEVLLDLRTGGGIECEVGDLLGLTVRGDAREIHRH